MGIVVRRGVAISLFGMSMVMASAGIASAGPNVVGMTYDKAAALVSKWGMTADISTSTGTELQQSDCLVVNGVMRPTAFGKSNTMLLSLDCNAAVATATQAGASAASPGGKKAKEEAVKVAWRETPAGQEWCAKYHEQYPNWDWPSIKGCNLT